MTLPFQTRRIGFLTVLLGALFATEGRACVVAYSALPALSPDVMMAASEAVAPFPGDAFETLPPPHEWNLLAGKPVLSSNLEIGPGQAESVPPDPAPSGLLLPILAILAGGAVWRYYISPTYLRQYRAIFGPLSQY